MQHTTLHRVMVTDAAVSGAFTLVLLLASDAVGSRLGLAPVLLSAVGWVLLAHVGILVWSVLGGRLEAGATYAVVANLGWVAGAGVVLAFGWLDPSGAVALTAVSVVVGTFGVLQWRGVR